MLRPDLPRQDAPRRHAVIAGTGRAGTSFLVRFLEHCGLDTGSRGVQVDARARAGLEHNLFDETAPYVVKDPWFFVYCDQVDQSDRAVDVVLVPVRDLGAAATSRVLQDRLAMADRGPWSGLPASSDVQGAVVGGVVYSLDPVDQARLLAVGFHHLIHWALSGGIPLILLDFPRIVRDPEYLIDTLWPWLGDRCEREVALAAFAAVAEPDQVRVELLAEVAATAGPIDSEGLPAAEFLDRVALRALLAERDNALGATVDELAVVRLQLTEARGQLVEAQGHLAESERRATETERNLALTLASSQDMLTRETRRLAQVEHALHAVTADMEDIKRTRSWRLTRPLRSVKGLGRRNARDEREEERAQEVQRPDDLPEDSPAPTFAAESAVTSDSLP